MNGAWIALGFAGVAAGAALARGRSGSRVEQYSGLSDRVYQILEQRGGHRGQEDSYALYGPPPVKMLILSDVTDGDGDEGVWINWIEGTPGERGAWAAVEAALVEAGARFAAGETNFQKVFLGWKKRGFFRIKKGDALEIYGGIEPGNKYFMKYL